MRARLFAAACLGLLAACGSRSTSGEAPGPDDNGPIESCVRYTAVYAKCQARTGDALGDVHVTVNQQLLADQTKRATSKAERARLDAACSHGVAQLRSVCP